MQLNREVGLTNRSIKRTKGSIGGIIVKKWWNI